jgi:hypothetical protein
LRVNTETPPPKALSIQLPARLLASFQDCPLPSYFPERDVSSVLCVLAVALGGVLPGRHMTHQLSMTGPRTVLGHRDTGCSRISHKSNFSIDTYLYHVLLLSVMFLRLRISRTLPSVTKSHSAWSVCAAALLKSGHQSSYWWSFGCFELGPL